MFRRYRKVAVCGIAVTIVAAVTALSFSAVSEGRPSRRDSATSAGIRTISRSRIRAIALREARSTGDPNPTSMTYSVPMTRTEANLVTSDDYIPAQSGGGAESFVIVEQGNFTVTDFQGPPGAPVPQGSVMTLVVDATTGYVTDFGVQNTVPNLSQYGPVMSVRRAVSGRAG